MYSNDNEKVDMEIDENEKNLADNKEKKEQSLKTPFVMTNQVFIDLCKKLVRNYANAHLDKTDGKQITTDDVYIVWLCKTLQNCKALVSTTLPDGMYYEITYNGDKKECYLDAYKKFENVCVAL